MSLATIASYFQEYAASGTLSSDVSDTTSTAKLQQPQAQCSKDLQEHTQEHEQQQQQHMQPEDVLQVALEKQQQQQQSRPPDGEAMHAAAASLQSKVASSPPMQRPRPTEILADDASPPEAPPTSGSQAGGTALG